MNCFLLVAFCLADPTQGHWSFQPVREPDLPKLSGRDRAWTVNPIDSFVVHSQRQRGLGPASDSERAVWLRRLSYDLTGLPPTPRQITAFLDDTSAVAHERVVEKLLGSPAYGQRWAQHWLDVARFSETEGFEYDRFRPGAWRYRDYVIDAMNADLPYDQFVLEQLAGDETTAANGMIASGFLRLGPIRRNAGNPEVAFSRNEFLTEMTDATGAVFLGLTFGCARCHDHKFDPISQEEYYGLQAFFAAVQEHDHRLAPSEVVARFNKRKQRLEKQIAGLKQKLDSEPANAGEIEQRIKELQEQFEPPPPTVFAVRNDLDAASEIHLLIRGDEFSPGKRVSKDIPERFRLPGFSIGDSAPARAALAHWITDHTHPTTARVLVNRLWHYHFGQGIVKTPNDFGINGSRPSHPELLDYLATEFVRSGFSIKHVQRLICTSRTYRQSSRSSHPERVERVDPENIWLTHFPRRRLSAEAIRDSMLMISGVLNDRYRGPSVIVPVDEDLVNLLYKPTQWTISPDRSQHFRRTVYLLAKRNLRVPFLEVFDQPDLQTSCAIRRSSTHAPQALEMLNGAFVNQMAERFAARLEREAGPEAEARINRAFLLTIGRQATRQQRDLAVQFLAKNSLSEFAIAMFNLNQFLYVE